MIKRTDGEFGFRIHGSRPVVVSAIEGTTPAEASGLEVGDIIVSLNDVNVLESSHSDIVKLAHSGPQTLRMELIRTIGSVGSIPSDQLLPFGTCCIISGFLLAKPDRSSAWKKRWFSFNSDNCLYWSRKLEDSELLGVLKLRACRVSWEGPTATRVITIRNSSSNNTLLQLQAASTELALKWIKCMSAGMERTTASGESEKEADPYLQVNMLYSSSPPSAVSDPDCSGFLGKFSHMNKVWRQRYFVLKDCCLFMYEDITSAHAVGTMLLHGYRAQSCSMVAKKNTFELIPPQTRFKHFWFMAESEVAKKRSVNVKSHSIVHLHLVVHLSICLSLRLLSSFDPSMLFDLLTGNVCFPLLVFRPFASICFSYSLHRMYKRMSGPAILSGETPLPNVAHKGKILGH